MQSMQRYQGVNLIELLAALVIAAILATVAVPSYVYYLQSNRLIGATNSLYYALQDARAEAIKRSTSVYVSFQTGSNWCYGINSGTACNCSSPSSCNIGSANYTSVSGLSLSATGLTGSSIQFESNHGAAGASSTVTFTLAGQSTAMSVEIGILGSLQICSGQISGYQSC